MRGLFIGRFQPFHMGHLSVIQRMFEECDTVIIGVGSAQEARQKDDPFSGGERIEMIRKVLDARGYENYEIYPVPDINCYPAWPYYVKTILPRFDAIYASSPIVIDLFRFTDVETRKVEVLNRDEWKGSEVRRSMREGKPWISLVPSEVAEYVSGMDIDLIDEHDIDIKLDPAKEAAHLLKTSGMSISVAESCTGGYIANRLTDIPGSSAYFERGLVTYSNESKYDLLGIPANLIDEKGAVSVEVASLMAESVRKISKTDIGLATTGIAGPGGGTANKPVGTVYVAISIDKKNTVRKLQLGGSRWYIKEQASEKSLDMLVAVLKDINNTH